MTDSDFFKDDTQETATEEVQQEIEKIKLGEKEYTQEELEGLVGVASKVKDLETKYSTKLDRVWPEYGKSQNEVRALKEELERVKTQRASGGEIDPETAQQALEQARKLGLVTKDDFKDIMSQNFRDLYKLERETDALVDDLNKMEREIDGTDGRPKFDKVQVLEFMRAEGYKNPMKAYKEMYEGQLDEWKARELTKSRAPGMSTVQQSTVGNKQPPDVSPTRDNLNRLVMEALEGNL